MSGQPSAVGWKTCDIKGASYLLYAGYPIRSVLNERGRAVFVFDDTQERRNALLAFWSKQQRVEPVAFIEAQNRIRDMVSQAVKPR